MRKRHFLLQKILDNACQNITIMKKIQLNMDVRIIVNVMELEFVHQMASVMELPDPNLSSFLLHSLGSAQRMLV